MNVLWLGPCFGADAGPLARFQSERGHQVRTLSCGPAADYSFHPSESTADVVHRIQRDWPVNWLVCSLPEYYPPPLRIEECPIPTTALISDWNLYFPRLEGNLCRFDVALCDRLGSTILRPRQTSLRYWGPIYTHRPAVAIPAADRDIDILFVGNMNSQVHAKRGRLLERIARLSDRYRVQICHGVFGDEYDRLLTRARILFNHTVRREMNMRCFEAIGAGALLFVEEENLEAKDFLTDRHELVLYRDDNLESLLEYFLANPAKAGAIALAGQQRAKDLIAERRLDGLFDWLATQPNSSRPFTQLSAREKLLAEILFHAECLVGAQRALTPALLERALKEFPEAAEFHLAAGLFEAHEIPRALPSEAPQRVARVIEHFAAATHRGPECGVAWLNLARARGAAGDLAGELAALSEVLATPTVRWPGLLLTHPADRHGMTWLRQFAEGRPSLDLLKGAAAERMALILDSAGQSAQAESCAELALQFDPENDSMARLRANHALERGEVHRGAALLESVPIFPWDGESRLQRIQLYARMGYPDLARRLALESAAIFAACPAAAELKRRFEELVTELPASG